MRHRGAAASEYVDLARSTMRRRPAFSSGRLGGRKRTLENCNLARRQAALYRGWILSNAALLNPERFGSSAAPSSPLRRLLSRILLSNYSFEDCSPPRTSDSRRCLLRFSITYVYNFKINEFFLLYIFIECISDRKAIFKNN